MSRLACWHQELLVHDVFEDLPPQRRATGRVVRDLCALRLEDQELLLHLRREDRGVADDRDDAIDELRHRGFPLTGGGTGSHDEQTEERCAQ